MSGSTRTRRLQRRNSRATMRFATAAARAAHATTIGAITAGHMVWEGLGVGEEYGRGVFAGLAGMGSSPTAMSPLKVEKGFGTIVDLRCTTQGRKEQDDSLDYGTGM